MASKRTIKRIVLTGIWMLVGAGMVTLLVAANGKSRGHNCKEVAIAIRGTGDKYYISKSDIAGMLRHAAGSSLSGLPIAGINLAELEEQLEKNAWIQDAELYFDRANVLHVFVTERQPIARAFTNTGASFYIDSSGARLPLLAHISARVPVVTAYPAARKPAAKDSAVLRGVRDIVKYISAHDFWSAQLAQIDITPVGDFEILPTVGNHIIRIGKADSLGKKLDRLMLFYKQVLSKTGFDKYSVIDVQYEGQVVAVHRGKDSGIDSVQLQKNIKALLQADQMMEAHDAATALADTIKAVDTLKTKAPRPTAAASKPEAKPAAEKPKAKAATTGVKKVEPKKAQPVKETKKPKAVMQRRT